MSDNSFKSGSFVRAIDTEGRLFIGIYMYQVKGLGHFVETPEGQRLFCKKNHVALAEAEEIQLYVKAVSAHYKRLKGMSEEVPLAAQNIECM